MSAATTQGMRQEPGTVKANPLGLDKKTAGKVIDMLNADLASMMVLYHQYHKHHWIVEGAQFLELHLLLEAHYTELHDQFDVVAERIVALGGLPVVGPTEIEQNAYITHEVPGMFDLRTMLQNDIAAEGKIAQQMRKHIASASDLGDYGSENILKTIIEAGEKRAAFLQKHLEPESLTRHISVE